MQLLLRGRNLVLLGVVIVLLRLCCGSEADIFLFSSGNGKALPTTRNRRRELLTFSALQGM
jgi:hypothetical protein